GELDDRQAEDGARAHGDELRAVAHRQLDGDRDLPLDFLRGPAWILRDDGDADRRDVGVSLDLHVLECPHPESGDQAGGEDDKPTRAEGPANQRFYHGKNTTGAMIDAKSTQPRARSLSRAPG